MSIEDTTICVSGALRQFVADRVGSSGDCKNVSGYPRALIRGGEQQSEERAFQRLKAELSHAWSALDSSHQLLIADDINQHNRGQARRLRAARCGAGSRTKGLASSQCCTSARIGSGTSTMTFLRIEDSALPHRLPDALCLSGLPTAVSIALNHAAGYFNAKRSTRAGHGRAISVIHAAQVATTNAPSQCVVADGRAVGGKGKTGWCVFHRSLAPS